MKINFFKGIGANVILLAIVSLLNDISSEMIFAIFPFYIVSLGGTGIALGLIGGLGDSVSGLLKVVAGYWSDRIGKKKPFVFWGYLSSSIAKAFYPLIGSWTALAVLVPIERTGKGLRSAPRDTMISVSTEPQVKGRAFGLHRAFDTFGALVGASGALLLFWLLEIGFKKILGLAAFLSFLSLIPLYFVTEKPMKPQKVKFIGNLKNLPWRFYKYLGVVTLFSLGNFTYMFFVMKAKSSFSFHFSESSAVAIPILLYVWYNFIYALSSIPAGMLSDKFGRKRAVEIGYLLFTLVCAGFIFADSVAAFLLLFTIYGLFFGLIEGNQRAFVTDLVPKEVSGTAMGLFHTMVSLAVLPAGLIAGILWNVDPMIPFVYGTFVGLISFCLFFLI